MSRREQCQETVNLGSERGFGKTFRPTHDMLRPRRTLSARTDTGFHDHSNDQSPLLAFADSCTYVPDWLCRQTGMPAVSDRWWRAFDDPQLHQLVTRALEGNLNLQASFQRLRQARAIAQRLVSVGGAAGSIRPCAKPA